MKKKNQLTNTIAEDEAVVFKFNFNEENHEELKVIFQKKIHNTVNKDFLELLEKQHNEADELEKYLMYLDAMEEIAKVMKKKDKRRKPIEKSMVMNLCIFFKKHKKMFTNVLYSLTEVKNLWKIKNMDDYHYSMILKIH